MKLFSPGGVFILIVCFTLTICGQAQAQTKTTAVTKTTSSAQTKDIRVGKASYYAGKFHGRKTASGEVYRKELYTAACNLLPMDTWVKITNLANNLSVIAKINDRLHAKNSRLVDLSESAARKLGYISRGIAQVKVEILPDYVSANPDTQGEL